MKLCGFLGHGPIKLFTPKAHAAGLWPARRRLAVLLGAVVLALLWLAPAWAKDGDLDNWFNPGVGATSAPMLWGQFNYSDTSGKMMITGNFRQMGGAARTDIARVFADGSLDTSFDAGIIDAQYVNNCILLNPGDPHCQMLICGDFSIPSSSGTYYGFARLNFDGSVDPGFGHVFSSRAEVQSIGIQSSGNIIVVGFAMPVNGYSGQAFYLLRVLADGTVDTSYPMRSAPGGNVNSVWTYPATDPTYPNCVRLFGTIPRFSDPTHVDHMLLLGANGSTVSASIGDEVVNGNILGMAFQGSNTVIFGAFTQVHGTSMNGIARLLPTGGLDPTFNIGTGANGHVKRVTIVNIPNVGTKLVLNGYFNSFNRTPCGNLVRLNTNGSVDTTFKAGTGADDRIWNMNLQGDGSWVVLGAFHSFNGSPRQCLASLAGDGSLNSTFTSFTTDYQPSTAVVYAIQDSPQGLYIAGSFSGYGGKLHRRVARLNFDGTPDGTFRAGMGGVVYSMTTQPDGKILVAGHFGIGEGYVGCTSLARLNLDGSMDLTFKPVLTKADGTLPDLYMVDESDDGKIVIGGDFAKIADANHVMQPRTAFARLNADGTLDPTFNAQINIPGGSNIRVNGGGNMNGLYPMAGYVFYQGAACGFFTRLTSTGEMDTSFGSSQGPAPHVNLFNGEARCGTDQNDGKIIIGGDFIQMIDGSVSPPMVNHIARFTANGLFDNTFPAVPGASGPIYVMERQTNGKILIGGAFTSYNGVTRNNIARIKPDGSLDSSFDPRTGANGPVYAIAWNSYINEARIGGAFTTYNNVSRVRIAQIIAHGNPSIAPLQLLLD